MRHPNKKGKKKTIIFADNILYVEIPKDHTHTHTKKNLLEKINKFSKVAGNKINIQKSVTFLSIDNKLSERGIKKTIPSQIIKYLGTNLTK